MAVNYPSQTYTTSPPSAQLPLYGAAQQPSPASSTSPTPGNGSPTSPRVTSMLPQLPLQTRQLRPPKTPLYVPAVLRPTERPVKQSPLTPPKSLHGSWDSLEEDEPGRPLSRRSAGDNNDPVLDRVEEEWLGDEELSEVTGLPSKEHWKPDNASPSCDSPACRYSFNLFIRRHHCRHCGHIFCSAHTPFTVPLDQNAHFHPDGHPSRACQHCHSAWRRWEHARLLRRQDSQTSSERTATGSALATPKANPGARGNDPSTLLSERLGEGPKGPDVTASSVPRDWNWSTF